MVFVCFCGAEILTRTQFSMGSKSIKILQAKPIQLKSFTQRFQFLMDPKSRATKNVQSIRIFGESSGAVVFTDGSGLERKVFRNSIIYPLVMTVT